MPEAATRRQWPIEVLNRFVGPFHEIQFPGCGGPVHRYAVCDRWCGHLPGGYSAKECNVCGGVLDIHFALDVDGIDYGIVLTSLICSTCEPLSRGEDPESAAAPEVPAGEK